MASSETKDGEIITVRPADLCNYSMKLVEVRDRLNDPRWQFAGVSSTYQANVVVHHYHFFRKPEFT